MTNHQTSACVALTVVLGLARPAAAHPLDLGYLRLTAEGDAVTAVLDLHVRAAARLLGAAPGAVDPMGSSAPRPAGGAVGVPAPRLVTLDATALAARADALADATLRGAPIVTPAGPCRWTAASAARHDTTASLTVRAACPAAVRALAWTLPFVRDARVSTTFQVLVKARLAGDDRIAIADRTRPRLELSAAPALGLAAFVWTGVEHIGAAPGQWHGADGWKLPDGLDHILFLVALMLAGGGLARTLGTVSGFTLGHSITLALSALHVVRPPARLIEPLIALTIAWVAAQAFAGRAGHRWRVAACFGLIHGFGFATALHQLELPTGELVPALLGYNLGVELGQVAIVLATAPLILPLQRHRRLRPVARGLAALICAAGVYWLFQRL